MIERSVLFPNNRKNLIGKNVPSELRYLTTAERLLVEELTLRMAAIYEEENTSANHVTTEVA